MIGWYDVNDTLRRALADARLDEVAVATSLGVDPKTVRRWLSGRLPQRRHRWDLADLIGRNERDLWPELAGPQSHAGREILTTYPHRAAVPREVWRALFTGAQRDIGVLVYAGLFLAEDPELVRLLAEKARADVTVRLLLGDPDSPTVSDRGTEEGIGDAIAAKIRNTIVLCRPLLAEGAQVRLHRTVLYNSIYCADDEMLVNAHVYGATAAHAPVLHLRQQGSGDLVSTYRDSFERVWVAGTPLV
jgi:hypothetical protein